MDQRKIRVAVIFGGQGPEHSVSCLGAGNTLDAIDRDRYEVIPIGITTDGRWMPVPDQPERLATAATALGRVRRGRRPAATARRRPRGDPASRGAPPEAAQIPRCWATSTWSCRSSTARSARTARSRACWRWRGQVRRGGRAGQRGRHRQGVHEADLRGPRPAGRAARGGAGAGLAAARRGRGHPAESSACWTRSPSWAGRCSEAGPRRVEHRHLEGDGQGQLTSRSSGPGGTTARSPGRGYPRWTGWRSRSRCSRASQEARRTPACRAR